MKISKASFFLAVIIYMIALIIFSDLPNNTVTTGLMSKFYFFKIIFDAALAAVAVLKIGEDIKHSHWDGLLQADEENLTFSITVPNVYFYGVLLIYFVANFALHLQGNAESTGLASIWFLVWGVADIGLGIVSRLLLAQAIKAKNIVAGVALR